MDRRFRASTSLMTAFTAGEVARPLLAILLTKAIAVLKSGCVSHLSGKVLNCISIPVPIQIMMNFIMIMMSSLHCHCRHWWPQLFNYRCQDNDKWAKESMELFQDSFSKLEFLALWTLHISACFECFYERRRRRRLKTSSRCRCLHLLNCKNLHFPLLWIHLGV